MLDCVSTLSPFEVRVVVLSLLLFSLLLCVLNVAGRRGYVEDESDLLL